MFRKRLTKYHAAKKVMLLYSEDENVSSESDFSSGSDISDSINGDKESRQDVIDILEGLENVQQLEKDSEILSWINQYEQPKTSTSINFLKKILIKKTALATVAVLLLTIGLVFSFDWKNSAQKSDWQGYVTRIGEQRTVKLNDGSLVTLNTGTELLVNINSESRQLILKRGEAHFNVAKDPARPFSVDLGDNSVTALGTIFDILKTPEKITVTVLEGAVALHKNDLDIKLDLPSSTLSEGENIVIGSSQHKRLDAGKIAELDLSSKKVTSYTHPNIQQTQEWRSGKLRFDQIALKNVIPQLNRYSRKKIIIQDPSIMELKIYAVIRVDRIDLALASLEEALPIKVVRYFDHTALVAKK